MMQQRGYGDALTEGRWRYNDGRAMANMKIVSAYFVGVAMVTK
jgi:hypothetical protein